MDNLEIDYKKAAQQLRSGKALFGKDGLHQSDDVRKRTS